MTVPKYNDPFSKRKKQKVSMENKQRNHETLKQGYEFNRGSSLVNMKRAMENRTPPAFVNLYSKNSKMNEKYW